jgi:hypothetical protein
VQEEQLLRGVLTVEARGRPDLGDDPVMHQPVQPALPLGRPALQLRGQHLPGEVVQDQAPPPARDVWLPDEPVPHLRGLAPDGDGEQVLGGRPGHGTRGQPGGVGLARHLADHPLEQGGDQVRRVGELGGQLALAHGVGQQGQRQRMPAGEREQGRVQLVGDADSGEELAALGSVQAVQPQNCAQLTPPRHASPGGVGRVPAGQDRDGVVGKLGQQLPRTHRSAGVRFS